MDRAHVNALRRPPDDSIHRPRLQEFPGAIQKLGARPVRSHV